MDIKHYKYADGSTKASRERTMTDEERQEQERMRKYPERTEVICTADGSTSYYLSKEQGQEIQAMIDKKGLEETISHYAGMALNTIHINYGMGENVLTDEKLWNMYYEDIEAGNSWSIEDSEVFDVVKECYHGAHITYFTPYDIDEMEWEQKEYDLHEIIEIGEQAYRDYISDLFGNNVDGVRDKIEAYIHSKMNEHLKKKNITLTEEQKEHIDMRGYGSHTSIITYTDGYEGVGAVK